MAFDPDAYLADVGKPAPKSGGGFDPDAYLAGKGAPPKRFPWEAEAVFPVEDRIGRANRTFAENTEAIPEQKATMEQYVPTTVTGNIAQMAGNFGRGVKTLGGIAMQPQRLAEPAVRRELERGLSDTITLGLAERAARAVDPEAFGPEAAAADAQAAPDVRAAGGIAGALLPSPAKFVAGKVGAAVPGTGVLSGAARGALQYEATAPAAAAITAEPGHRLDAAYDAATDPAGLIVSGGLGAASSLVRRAPERVKERGLEALSRGEAGGTANKALGRKAQAFAGEGGEDLYREIGGDKALEAGQSILAKSNPGIVAKQYTRRLNRLSAQTEPFHKAIDDAPDPRFADPAKAPRNGGIDLGLVQERLEASKKAALADGRGQIAHAYDLALARLRGQYGTDGVILPGTKLPSRSMQNYANEIGRGLMPATDDPATRTLNQQAQRAIYKDVVGAIADEGERVGVDVKEFRALNRKIATFTAARDALADRAARDAQGHTTVGTALMDATLPTSGALAGGVEGFLLGTAAAAVRRSAMPVARTADFALAKLVQASRAGAKPAQLGQMALELGMAREVADRIARGGLGAYQKPADERDYTEY